MSTSLTTQELQLVQSEFKACDRWCEEPDIIFAYPSSSFKKDAAVVAKSLQRGYEYLLLVAPVIVPPNLVFGRRLIVGYRHHQVDENKPKPRDIWPGYAEWHHRINAPWYLLTERDEFPVEDQPEFSCSHELVHPFECVFLKNNLNKKWKEGFCDCLRVGVLTAMGMSKHAQFWENCILEATAKRKKDEYHDAAGRILGYLKQREAAVGIRTAIQELISTSMDQRLDSSNEIQFSK